MNPVLSIIIPTHNSHETISRCINSLTSQSPLRTLFEIIVVDDGSYDTTVETAKNAGADMVIITNPCFQGKARNIGVTKARGSIIAFIDSDCAAKDGWIKSIINEVGPKKAVSGPIENGNPKSYVAWGEYFLEFGGWDEFKRRSKILLFPGCNGACTKDDFLQSGGFIETGAAEDSLLGSSLRKNDVEIYFIPESQIFHFCRTEIKKVVRNMEKLGHYFVISRRKDPSLSHSGFTRSAIPIIFLGKIIKSFEYAIHARKVSKYFGSFPVIIIGTISFCKGIFNELR